MSLSTVTVASPVTPLFTIPSRDPCYKLKKNVWSNQVKVKPLCVQLKPFERRGLTPSYRAKHASLICAAALNATCAAEQTQTVTRQSSTITVAPIQGKEKSPDLDDGGSGLPPRDDDGGGGGGGGGGGHWSGGFFFFGFLAFLGFLKDQESGDSYGDERRRR
ncbi:hypothetical protein ABFS82_08G167100 [Erythranthe guttata]|nr:PREDICTED: uncharacterized protein LOC105961954 [Erythranthe guttata]|eukprot:XP_012841666.1 PREDICTED: uncharacterized protein LOC105961954 [Erythranthe guttata]